MKMDQMDDKKMIEMEKKWQEFVKKRRYSNCTFVCKRRYQSMTLTGRKQNGRLIIMDQIDDQKTEKIDMENKDKKLLEKRRGEEE